MAPVRRLGFLGQELERSLELGRLGCLGVDWERSLSRLGLDRSLGLPSPSLGQARTSTEVWVCRTAPGLSLGRGPRGPRGPRLHMVCSGCLGCSGQTPPARPPAAWALELAPVLALE